MKLTTKKVNALDLKKGDFVYNKREFGYVIIKDETFIHNHKYVIMRWIAQDGHLYYTKYYTDDNKIVEKVIIKEGNEELTQ